VAIASSCWYVNGDYEISVEPICYTDMNSSVVITRSGPMVEITGGPYYDDQEYEHMVAMENERWS
jgi:hypothetical protein